MMGPTPEYLAAPEVGRTRPEATHGALRVVIENYADETHVFGKSVVYLSCDDGKSFVAVDWKISWPSGWKAMGRLWPPHDLYIEGFDEEALYVGYVENSYDGPVERKAKYLLGEKRWRLQ
jgi:hypothetical protein